ncbi:DUF4361 domain-containing protein [Paraflavisolibacter sp. H34]|uniref:BT_3044 domain-containing protein n=1 Tax=Huijunlia imazamoxiresistens TaxID=3127457 RepID=UPI003016599A
MKAVTYLGIIGLALSLGGCEKLESPLDSEQYLKSVYLVGANQSSNEGMQVVNLPYKSGAGDTAATYISVATGGSLVIDRDLTAQVQEAGGESVKQYNSMYLYKPTDIKYSLLNSASYAIPDFTVPLKRGATYGRLPIAIKTAGLHPDSLYALTFKIGSVSDPDYIAIRKTDSVLLFSFRLYNAYSGTYQATGRFYTFNNAAVRDTASLSLGRTMKAINHNTVRFFHLATTESMANVAAGGVTATVNADNSLTVSPWGSLVLSASGGTYDGATATFTIWYNYQEGSVTKQFKGQFTKSGI